MLSGTIYFGCHSPACRTHLSGRVGSILHSYLPHPVWLGVRTDSRRSGVAVPNYVGFG